MDLKNIISHVDIEAKRATVFPGEPLVHRMRQPFTVEYDADIDLRELDLSIVITPFLLNVIPLLWLLGGTCSVDSMDEDLFSSLELVRDGFRAIYPDIPWEGQVIPHRITETKKYRNDPSGHQVLFFSGGVDSTYSASQTNPDITTLLTVQGHDIALENELAWRAVSTRIESFALSFNFRTRKVRANTFRLLRCGDIHMKYPELKPWYGMVQHGPGLSGLAFPLAAYNGWERILFSSSVGEKMVHVPWGSHPFLEPKLKMNGITVVSEGTELIWSDKVSAIVAFYRERGMNRPFLRICLDGMNGNAVENCAFCEKCLRGMVCLILNSEDPSEWGFPVVKPLFGTIQKNLISMSIPGSNKYIWDRMHVMASRTLPESRGKYRQFLTWFVDWYRREHFNERL